MRKLLFAAFLTIITMNAPTPAAEKRPMTVEDLFLFQRVADPQISPDGKTVAYQVTDHILLLSGSEQDSFYRSQNLLRLSKDYC